MASNWYHKRWWWLIGALIVVLSVLIAVWQWPTTSTTKTVKDTNSARQRYATLYQAAWRQDDGHQPTLVTATLLVPPAVTLLGQDTGRSSAEEQEWHILKDLGPNAVPFVVTLDSVSQAVPDDTILHGLYLRLGTGKSYVLDSWKPIIAPSRVVNTNTTPTSQIGVAIFKLDYAVDWTSVPSVTLALNGIPNESYRVFSWTEPRLLLDVE